MDRVTISMTEAFAADLSAFMVKHGYANRSEAVRDLARSGLERLKIEDESSGQCVATVAYVYDYQIREIPQRLAENYHSRHDLTVATMLVRLDHSHCLELAVLRGDTVDVREFAKRVIAERGVTHGRVNFVPADIDYDHHPHSANRTSHVHVHAHPKILD